FGALAEIVHIHRVQFRLAGADHGEPLRQRRDVAHAALRFSTAPDRTIVLDHDAARVVADGQQLRLRENCVRRTPAAASWSIHPCSVLRATTATATRSPINRSGSAKYKSSTGLMS